MSEFFDAFNPALTDMEAAMGESWQFNNSSYPAIAVDDLRFSKLPGAAGGPLSQATSSLYIRKSVLNASSVQRGSIILVRNQKTRVMAITDDGDDSVTLVCGPVNVAMPQH